MSLRGTLATRTLWAAVVIGIAASPPAAGIPVTALAPIQNPAGDAAMVAVLEEALRGRLESSLPLIAADRVRDALRSLRIRRVDDAPPALLGAALESMGADLLISVTLHDALRRAVPELTISTRVYRGGELTWADFRAASGLDRRTVLGLRVDAEIDSLAARLSDGMVRELEGSLADLAGDGSVAPAPEPWALLPFSGLTARNGIANADTLTEAARATAMAAGVNLLSPNRVREVLRQRGIVRWDEVNDSVRKALLDGYDARLILTGQVEIYETGGGREPEPRVSVAMQLIDTATGSVLWQEGLERKGWDSARLFGIGRVFSQGALAQRLVDKLTTRLLASRGRDGGGHRRMG